MCPAFQHTEQNNLRIASKSPIQLRPRKLDYVGLLQIQLIDGQQLLQQYELADSENCSLPLLELLQTPQRFIALLQNGLLFAADLLPSETGSKGLIQLLQPQADLKLTGMPGTCFDAKRNLIWVFTRIRDQRGRGQHLLGYDLDALLNSDTQTDHSQPQPALKYSIAVPYDEVDELSPEEASLTLRSDGKLALYARNDKGRFADRRQGLLLIDPNADQDTASSYLPCPFKPVPDDISIKPALFYSANTKQVFTPAADGVEITEHKGDSVYSFALTALDLETQSSWSQTVRRMSASQIAEEGDAESITEVLANIAEGNTRSSESDEWQDYLTSLSSVFVDSGALNDSGALDNNGICAEITDTSDQIIWLAWHDGCIRALKRNPASGQVQLSALARLQSFSDDALQPYFMNLSGGFTPVQIKALCNSDNSRQLHIRLGDDEMGQDFYANLSALMDQQGQLRWFDAEPALSETEAGIILPCTPYSAEPVQIDPARQAVLSVTGRIQIETTDLDSAAGRLDALQQVLKLMPAIGQQLSQRQQPLYFAFADAMGCEQSEAQFFPYAALANKTDDEQPTEGFRLLLEIVRLYSETVKALPVADSEPAIAELSPLNGPITAPEAPLRDAVITLCEHAEALPVIAEYFNTLPAEESLVDAFHISRTLPVIRELHADTPALTDFLAQLPAPYNDSSFSKPEHDPYDDWGYED